MSKRHSTRGTDGRFTKSGAPIDGDPSVYEHVDAPSADPQGEHDRVPGYPEFCEPYPAVELHDPARGAQQRLIPHRRAVEIDGETGEALREIPEHELRAMVPDLRTRAHLAAAKGHTLIENLMGARHGDYAPAESQRGVPGSNGFRLRSEAVQTDDEPRKTNTGIDNSRGLYR